MADPDENPHVPAPAAPTATVIPTLSPPPPLEIKNVNSANNSENWKVWKQRWNNYGIISNLAQQTNEYKLALFFHALGTDGLTLFIQWYEVYCGRKSQRSYNSS